MTRTAISPRLAISTFEKGKRRASASGDVARRSAGTALLALFRGIRRPLRRWGGSAYARGWRWGCATYCSAGRWGGDSWAGEIWRVGGISAFFRFFRSIRVFGRETRGSGDNWSAGGGNAE